MPDDIDPLVPQPRLPTAAPVSVEDATRALLGGFGNAVYGMSQLPKQAFQSSENLRQGGDYDPAPIMQTVSLLAGGGMPAAEEGAAGIFGGRLAKTADLDALRWAQKLQRSNWSPNYIHKATGWFQGPDKNWRFEIPDTGAQATYMRGSPMPANPTLGSTLRHPVLYDAYPDLKEIPVKWEGPAGTGAHTPYAGEEEITLGHQGESPTKGITGPALHETQHAIQWREGFSGGTSPDVMKPYAAEALVKHGYLAPGTSPGNYKILNKNAKAILDNVAYQAYTRHAGEVEANNVMNRYLLGNIDKGVYKIPPWETETVPASKQIVRPPFAGSPYENQWLLNALNK